VKDFVRHAFRSSLNKTMDCQKQLIEEMSHIDRLVISLFDYPSALNVRDFRATIWRIKDDLICFKDSYWDLRIISRAVTPVVRKHGFVLIPYMLHDGEDEYLGVFDEDWEREDG
jgi:hypothetical protein